MLPGLGRSAAQLGDQAGRGLPGESGAVAVRVGDDQGPGLVDGLGDYVDGSGPSRVRDERQNFAWPSLVRTQRTAGAQPAVSLQWHFLALVAVTGSYFYRSCKKAVDWQGRLRGPPPCLMGEFQ